MIGRGGMGTVYLGEHTVIASRVAIKVLLEKLACDEGLVARFYAEARAVNLIGHENIVNIFDMNVVPPNRYYLVMEYLEGHSLDYLLTKPVPAAIAIPILLQVCDALAAAHAAGIVHRDLKPENIFLIKRGRSENFVKVLDFGLAKLLDTQASNQTATGLIVGTPEFMSPEQANSTPVDGRSDIYSLGCIAWLLATGRLPFPQRGLTDLLLAHRNQTPKAPHEVNQAVSPAWSQTIMKAMSKRPEDRYQSAQEFAAAMEEVLQRGSQTLAVQPALERRAPRPPLAPTVVPTQPAQPAQRHSARFEAIVADLNGKPLGTFQCNDISKGGMFLSTAGELPAVFSRLKITLPSAGNLELLAEVVRHVPAEQAQAWGMPPGIGVQFLDVTPSLRDDINRLVQGLPVKPALTTSKTSSEIEAVLAYYRERISGDHYQLLGLLPTARLPETRMRCDEAQDHLNALKNQTRKPNELAQLDAVLARIDAARQALSHPTDRARYDANRGNWQGIARCILGGLGPIDLERLRQEFLAAHPSAAGSAHVKFLASKGYEHDKQLKEALDACENALQIDPLNLQLHQRQAVLASRLKGKQQPPGQG